jgi:DNA-binding transcriptional LysR family regulator
VNLLRNASLDALIAFAEFAEDGNFSRAALRLHISQPALHTKVAKLARTLEAPLYVRRGRSIEITPAGRKVQRFARELAAATVAFQDELLETESHQPIVLAAGEGSYLYLLGEGIKAFRGGSKRSLTLMTADGNAALDAVMSGRAHLGVASFETAPRDVVVQPLTRVGQMLAMPARHALASKRRVRLQDLDGTELIVPPVGRPHRTMISHMLQSARVDWSVAVEATGWELMLHFVRLGLGTALVNACCRLPPGVVGRPVPELPALQYYIFHRGRTPAAGVMELEAKLLASANAWQERNRQ